MDIRLKYFTCFFVIIEYETCIMSIEYVIKHYNDTDFSADIEDYDSGNSLPKTELYIIEFYNFIIVKTL